MFNPSSTSDQSCCCLFTSKFALTVSLLGSRCHMLSIKQSFLRFFLKNVHFSNRNNCNTLPCGYCRGSTLTKGTMFYLLFLMRLIDPLACIECKKFIIFCDLELSSHCVAKMSMLVELHQTIMYFDEVRDIDLRVSEFDNISRALSSICHLKLLKFSFIKFSNQTKNAVF